MRDVTLDHGPCWVCGAEAADRCDSGYDGSCQRWISDAHLGIEAEPWDKAGWDGGNVHWQAHRYLALDSRAVWRGYGLSPAARWAGEKDQAAARL